MLGSRYIYTGMKITKIIPRVETTIRPKNGLAKSRPLSWGINGQTKSKIIVIYLGLTALLVSSNHNIKLLLYEIRKIDKWVDKYHRIIVSSNQNTELRAHPIIYTFMINKIKAPNK